MPATIGEDGLGDFARTQIDRARNDPRLGRKRGATVADFWIAMEEAERVRMLGIMGLHELTHTLERHEQLLGASRDDDDLPDNVARKLQAAWERAESARIEIANGHPHLNAQALGAMNSALDALVEEWVPAMRTARTQWLIDQAIQQTDEQHPELADTLTPELRETLVAALRSYVGDQLPKLDRLLGSGIERYETRLSREWLGAPADRPIPQDLDRALAELGALRNVLTHRAGRVDQKALEQAPSLRYQDGELVRISAEEYREYSAAVRCYAGEIQFRSVRNWPKVTDEKDGPNLAGWRGYRVIGA
jgi:hypothetical protein